MKHQKKFLICRDSAPLAPVGAARVKRPFSGRLALLVYTLICLLTLPGAFALASEADAIRGGASWYGTPFHGRPTANGEIFNTYALTAAHKGLPFGTIVRVHNLKNGKHVLVRVNDRGPYVEGRVVDLSFKAAQMLGMANSGVAPVRLEIISGKKGKPLTEGNAFYVHLADERSAFKARGKAAKLGIQLGTPVKTLYRPDGPAKGFALCLGPFTSFKEADARFMALQQGAIAGIGVIEAPAQGTVPFYTPDSSHALRSPAQGQEAADQYAMLWKTLAASYHHSLYALSLLALENKNFPPSVL